MNIELALAMWLFPLFIITHLVYLWRRGADLFYTPLSAFYLGITIIYFVEPLKYLGSLLETYPSALLIDTWLGCSTAVVFVAGGYHLPFGSRMQTVVPNLPDRLIIPRIAVVGFGLFVLGCFSYWTQMNYLGGFFDWVSVHKTARNIEGLSKIIKVLEFCLIVGCSMILFSAVRGNRFVKLAWLLTILVAAFLALAVGSRSRLIMIALSGFFAYSFARRQRPSLIWAVVLVIVLFVSSEFIRQFRGHFPWLDERFQTSDFSESSHDWALNGLLQSESVNDRRKLPFNVIVNFREYIPRYVDFQPTLLLEFFTRPIPRSLLPEKSYPYHEAQTLVFQATGLSQNWVEYGRQPILTGPAPTYVGFWYFVGGNWGFLFGGLVTGIFFRGCFEYGRRNADRDGVAFILPLIAFAGFSHGVATPFFFMFRLPPTLILLVIFLQFVADRHSIAPTMVSDLGTALRASRNSARPRRDRPNWRWLGRGVRG